MTDTLPRVQSLTQHRVNDGTPLSHARDGTGNRLEPATGQSDIALPSGLQCEIPAVNKAVPLPFPSYMGSSHTWNCLRYQFNSQKWRDSIRILE